MAFKRRTNFLNAIAGNAGNRVLTKLTSGVYHRALRIRASCTIQIAVAVVTNIRNKGSAFAIWDFLGLTGGGDSDVVSIDGRTTRALSEFYSPSGLSATRLTSTAIGTYNLVEEATIQFSFAGDADPHAWAYTKRDQGKDLYFFAQLRADGGTGGLVTQGGATVTMSNQVLQVEEIFDPTTVGQPDFIPFVRQITKKISANGLQDPVYINAQNALRGLFIQETTDQGEVGDILVDLSLFSGKQTYWGPAQVPIDDIQRAQELEFGGQVYATGQGPSATGANIGAYTYLHFAENGRMPNMIPATESDLQLRVTANTSAQAGVTQSNLVITSIEGVRDSRTKPKLVYSL